MKSIIYAFILIVAVTLVGCQDAEEPQGPLFGSWENRNHSDSLDLWFV
jgi:hypothetical protein